MIDPDVMRDAGEELKAYYSEDRDHRGKCVGITYEFRKKCNDDGTLVVVHKRYERGWGSPTSYSYDALEILAERYREEQRRIRAFNRSAWEKMKSAMYFQCVGGRDFWKKIVDPK